MPINQQNATNQRVSTSIALNNAIPRKASVESLSNSTACTNKNDDGNWYDISFIDFAQNSTFHGIRDFCNARGFFMRHVWLSIILFSILCSFYGCYMIIAQFLENPIVVSYFVADSDGKMPLPDVIICPFNRFNRTFFEEWNITGELAQYIEFTFPGPMYFGFQDALLEKISASFQKYEDEMNAVVNRLENKTFNSFITLSSIQCKAFFPQPNICENATEIMTSAGKCYRISSTEQTIGGFGQGHTIVITLPTHLYTTGINQMLNEGIIVKLVEPGHGVDNDLTFIPAGVHAIIPLAATRYDFMNDPPRYSCLESPQPDYSAVWCYDLCYTEIAENQCNCSVIAASTPRKPNICTPKQLIDCFYPVLSSEDSQQVQYNCKAKCQKPCNYIKYSKTVSLTNLSPERARVITSEENAISLKNTIVLDVFYTSLDYTVIKHMVAMTPSSFIAQLGGQISLWIGGSLISIAQLIMYIGVSKLIPIYNVIKERMSKRKQSNDI